MPDQDSWDLPYYTLYESTTPKMLYSDDFFGGVCYATRDDSWSKFYQVHEREGKEVIADRFQEGKNSQLKTFMQHAEGGAIYSSFRDAAGDITKAAGKIFVRVKDGSKIVFASGFWLEGDLFVTCSHFYANHYVTDPQKKEAEEHLKNDQFPDYWNTYVDSSTVAHDYDQDLDQEVKLLAADNEADIAIFQAVNANNRPSSSLRLSQLHALSSDGERETVPSWTVAYALPDKGLEMGKPTDRKVNPPLFDVWKKLPAPTEFDLQVEQYYHVLTTERFTDPRLHQAIKCQAKPKFNDIYYVNNKAIALGEAYRPVEEVKSNRKTIHTFHTMSGFFGTSGAMILTFRDGLIDFPVVIGLFYLGDQGSIYNSYQAFTEQGLVWIKSQVEQKGE